MITRFGIIAMGGIGLHHARIISSLPNAAVAAFSSRDAARAAHASSLYPAARAFANHSELLQSGACDAVLICTPHYQHVPIAVEAFAAGLHVLVEKPLAVSAGEARRAVEAAEKHPHLLFGIMLNQRTHPAHQHIRRLIQSGELGHLTRISWTATHWFRPNSYYTASPWRATWAGEGGGVLINQCHHNLDLLWWLTGLMPRRITAVGFAGKHHPIETEDEVSAILEYESGTVGHFFASTGEAAGTNRLEIAGTRGKVILEDGLLRMARVGVDTREYIKTSQEPFSAPAAAWETVALPAAANPDHRPVIEDFVAAIEQGKRSAELIAPAADDLAAMELSNAMLMAGLTREAVELPLDARAFEGFMGRMKS
ncbi:MAG TPA: Gfo/Idh/MocA family oxidoreductase [Phycisphaerae bacterium]|nr:Gfo/Idh/MocA family oxidoreductase [Phycisphaerae bacterium]